jgi:hypothetical protein
VSEATIKLGWLPMACMPCCLVWVWARRLTNVLLLGSGTQCEQDCKCCWLCTIAMLQSRAEVCAAGDLLRGCIYQLATAQPQSHVRSDLDIPGK